jgi:hypothetical protein
MLMWRLRSWPSASLSWRRAALLGALLFLVFLLGARPISADAGIQIKARAQSYKISEALNFSLEAQSASPIVEVILFYNLDDSRLSRRIYPPFTPGPTVRIQYTEKLEPGQYVPGANINVWWRLRAADGSTLTTERETFEYTDNTQTWRTLTGQRVDYYWYGKDEATARKLLARADEAITSLEGEFGVTVKKRVRLYAYNSSTDMQRVLERRATGYDENITTLGQSIGDHTLLLLATHRDVNVTIAHELCHLVVNSATDNPYTDLPSWLSEGLAMYAEGGLRANNQKALDDAVRKDKLLSIRSMTSYMGRAEQVDLFYAESQSVVSFLIKDLGRDKLQQLLAVFAEGTVQEDALQRVYGFGLDELDNRWRASLKLGPRQRPTPTPAGPSSQRTDALGVLLSSLGDVSQKAARALRGGH